MVHMFDRIIGVHQGGDDRKGRIMARPIIKTALFLALFTCWVFLGCSQKEETAPAVAAVKARLKSAVRVDPGDFEAAPLAGGTAVLFARLAAFWVRDGHVYAGNGMALMWADGVDRAPVGINIDSIEAAIAGQLTINQNLRLRHAHSSAVGAAARDKPIVAWRGTDRFFRRGYVGLELLNDGQILGYDTPEEAIMDGFGPER